MKYKVIYTMNYSGGGTPDGMTTGTFYTSSQAFLSAQEWVAFGPAFEAYVWDGVIWRSYT